MFKRQKPAYVSLSDEELIGLMAEGHREALSELYDRYFDRLVWFCTGFSLSNEQASDVAQDVFMKLIEKPGSFDMDKKFAPWIYTVTANACRQQLRNQKTHLRILSNNVGETSTQNAQRYDRRQLTLHIQKLLTHLSDKEKQIYALRFEQELPVKDIAEILQLPEGSVKSGLHYLLKKLAHHLKEFSYEH